MPIKYKILFAVLFLSFMFGSIGSESAFGQTVVKQDFGDGVLDESSAAMENLLQLKWNGQNLELKREWDERLKNNKKKGKIRGNDELEDAMANLIKRGVPRADAKRLAAQMIAGGGDMQNFGGRAGRSELEKAFFAVSTEFGRTSEGSSGREPNKRLRFSGQSLFGRATIGNDDVEFEFEEVEGKERSFKIRDSGKGRFQFQFSFGDLFVRLLQTKTGKTQLVWINDDQVDVYVGDSFSNFTKRNPKVVEQMLLPLFERLGINMPDDVPDP